VLSTRPFPRASARIVALPRRPASCAPRGRGSGFTPRGAHRPPSSLDKGGNKSLRAVCTGGPVLWNREARRFLQVRCGRWACEACGESNRRAFVRRVLLGIEAGADAAAVVGRRPPRFLTLTSRPGESASVAIAQLSRRFEHLRQRVKVRYGGGFEFAGVVELTRRGMPHLHVVYRGPWLHQGEWSALAEASGFGPVVDVRRVRSGDVARYASKGLGGYLAKSLRQVWPRHFRRVRFSRAWASGWVVRRRNPSGLWRRVGPGEPEYEWWVARQALAAIGGGQGPPGSAVGAV
jgi:hypothetical protein